MSGDNPPLTKDLFSGLKAQELLRTYLLANNAGRAISRKMRADGTLAFEQALLSLREDGAPHRRQMSLAVPPYLQTLMLAYSVQHHADAERYFALIDELLTLPTHLWFVSLNYDLLLDANLDSFSPLQSMSDYVSGSNGWSLLKPHGSVNWFVELGSSFDPTRPPADLEVVDDPIKCAPVGSMQLHVIRGHERDNQSHGWTRNYPALALPEGPKDRLMVPQHHLDVFQGALKHAQEIDLLVLGYSGLDTEVLDLIQKSSCEIRRMTIVNRDPVSTFGVFETISRHGLTARTPDLFDGSFEQWIDGEGLRCWVREFGGPYPSATSPGQLRNAIDVRAKESRIRRRRSILDEQF